MENFETTKIENWVRNSVTLKLVIIGILIIILLIPTFFIMSLIEERQSLQSTTIEEVSNEWAHRQTVTGPLLTVPYTITSGTAADTKEVIRYLNITPATLIIKGNIKPIHLHRGIYNVAVYDSEIDFSGTFKKSDYSENIDTDDLLWDKAFLTIGISDNRGIKNEIVVNYNGSQLEVEPGTKISDISSGVTVPLNGNPFHASETTHFNFKINLQGSNNLSFVPLGSNTDVELFSNWENPSFRGAFLPDNRTVTDSGFKAHWNILELNRNFPSAWSNENNFNLSTSATGVDLLFGVEDYQRSMRSAKYAIMIICITFLVIFLVEILNKMKIHPFQYTMVGLALCLFYILLISISEHLNFNLAYWIATLIVVSMITIYSRSVFKAGKTAFILAAVLLGSYSFLFVILQLSDYALLVGSLGLTFILAATMYFTRNINWYNLQWNQEPQRGEAHVSG